MQKQADTVLLEAIETLKQFQSLLSASQEFLVEICKQGGLSAMSDDFQAEIVQGVARLFANKKNRKKMALPSVANENEIKGRTKASKFLGVSKATLDKLMDKEELMLHLHYKKSLMGRYTFFRAALSNFKKRKGL